MPIGYRTLTTCHVVTLQIISLKYRHYSWVAELIQIFIAISITVSFLVMGSAMKHTIDGLVNSHWNTKLEWMSKVWERTLPQSFHRCSSRGLANGLISLLAFGIIFIVSSCDPRGFVVMLDKVVSFSLNTEVGLFIFVMLRASRSEGFQHLTVPLPVGQRVFQLHWTLPIYFLFAVAYDVIQSIVEIAEHNLQHSSQPLLTNYSLS
ncbi:uncharacterized protein LOC116353057 [Oncorhynchus kisutch]|uniref:uncharacterized protein LOC116353057 n=1 Tax=Oncorhynchus kisutch TaxID=8019 RepID=UPI0012DE3F4E|nr:uncharacterized protein LOC116353057 [Oncorhynchus kisutch]